MPFCLHRWRRRHYIAGNNGTSIRFLVGYRFLTTLAETVRWSAGTMHDDTPSDIHTLTHRDKTVPLLLKL